MLEFAPMLRLFRTTAYLLILSLALNIMEWPFVDEILEEQAQATQQAQPDLVVSASLAADSLAVQDAAHDHVKHSTASIYHTLMDLLDTTSSLSFAAAEGGGTSPASVDQRFTSRTVPTIDRPPLSSLS